MDISVAMNRANELSVRGLGLVSPNPIVGAVILDNSGNLIGEGFHQRAGDLHAEIAAIQSATGDLTGATLVVTLEPCNHQGKTPPCTEAIIKSGIKRVVYSISDPNPIAQGGEARLKAAGILVESGVLAELIEKTNRAWIKKVKTGRPYLTMKIASTLDGKIAAADGSSKWITSDNSRIDVAKLRSECDAIVTGTGTVLADNPNLTVRGFSRFEGWQDFKPTRVVIGERELPATAQVKSADAETVHLQTRDLNKLLELASARGWNRVLIEAGPTLNSAFLKERLVDEIFWYQAPAILGNGRSAIGDLGITTLAEQLSMEMLESVEIAGETRNLRIHLQLRSA
jgi:diaminohydroxyphosphoribosylaminopyrimidine deaminase/5-amino-6-(5-phosphoribosylamino)uracil reductase